MRPLFILLLSVIVLPGCDRASDEARIEQTLGAMAAAVESGAGGDFIEHVHSGYQDRDGRDRQQLRRWLAAQRLRRESVVVGLTGIRVTVKNKSARSECAVNVLGLKGLIPDGHGRYRLWLDWRKESGDWQVYRAEWERAG